MSTIEELQKEINMLKSDLKHAMETIARYAANHEIYIDGIRQDLGKLHDQYEYRNHVSDAGRTNSNGALDITKAFTDEIAKVVRKAKI